MGGKFELKMVFDWSLLLISKKKGINSLNFLIVFVLYLPVFMYVCY